MESRIVTVRVRGVFAMLLQWLKRGEVFRAYADTDERRMTIFKPFLTKPYVTVPRHTQFGYLEAKPKEFLDALLEGSDDDFDLFAHEVGWHLLDGQVDSPEVAGIGSNDMLRRAQTVTSAERAAYQDLIVSGVDVLRFEGLP